jgi:hypothetical protein
MGSIPQYLEEEAGSFDECVKKLLGQAFDAACKALHDRGQPSIVREIIAKRILEAARQGERDPQRLCEAGRAGLSRLG